ncbi:hypothetical protein AVEN_159437-1 [Araneus ventricosus]|uniref:MULE transposase domain-containing protein n=1 Tax=Araneus ventricosus TaxID=182803 RepID=A0A4Y2A189_ARAVE|nr:hypothetical protein AVEN_159437-1 [Araneus ventricosus]
MYTTTTTPSHIHVSRADPRERSKLIAPDQFGLEERTENCRGALKSKNGIVLNVSNHVCKPDIAEIEVKKRICNARNRARIEDKEIPSIYREEMQPLFNKGYDFVTNISNFISVKTYLYLQEEKRKGKEREPKTAAEINISEDVTKMEEGTNFLLADVGDKDRMLVFATEDGKKCFKNYKTFLIDGKFKSSSKQFKQLYSVHVDIESSSDEISIIAATYALLSRKDTSMYDRLFSIL